MTMEVGAIVPLPKLSAMTVSPWLLEKFGMSFRKSKLSRSVVCDRQKRLKLLR